MLKPTPQPRMRSSGMMVIKLVVIQLLQRQSQKGKGIIQWPSSAKHLMVVETDRRQNIPWKCIVSVTVSSRSVEQLLHIFRALQTSRVLHISMNARWHMNQLLSERQTRDGWKSRGNKFCKSGMKETLGWFQKGEFSKFWLNGKQRSLRRMTELSVFLSVNMVIPRKATSRCLPACLLHCWHNDPIWFLTCCWHKYTRSRGPYFTVIHD